MARKYKVLRAYTEMVSKGYSDALIVHGSFGVGKSHQVLAALREGVVNFAYHSGFITDLQLYILLYRENGKVIFLDDCSNIFESDRAIQLLKPAMQPVGGRRLISYLTSARIAAPPVFDFKGRLIFCLNELPEHSLSHKALISRALTLDMVFSFDELMAVLGTVVQAPYKESTLEQRQAVLNYMKQIATVASDGLSIRTMLKGFDMALFSDEWRMLFRELISPNEKLAKLVELEHLPHAEKMAAWCAHFGLKSRSFFLAKHELDRRRGRVG